MFPENSEYFVIASFDVSFTVAGTSDQSLYLVYTSNCVYVILFPPKAGKKQKMPFLKKIQAKKQCHSGITERWLRWHYNSTRDVMNALYMIKVSDTLSKW